MPAVIYLGPHLPRHLNFIFLHFRGFVRKSLSFTGGMVATGVTPLQDGGRHV